MIDSSLINILAWLGGIFLYMVMGFITTKLYLHMLEEDDEYNIFMIELFWPGVLPFLLLWVLIKFIYITIKLYSLPFRVNLLDKRISSLDKKVKNIK